MKRSSGGESINRGMVGVVGIRGVCFRIQFIT